MNILIKHGIVLYKNKLEKLDILIKDNKIIDINSNIDINDKNLKVIDATNLTILPGLIDVHVHLREPGYEYKETIESGSKAALYGGYSTICCMPNTNPIIDNVKTLRYVLNKIKIDALVNVLPYASITKGELGEELVDFKSLSKNCFAFSDDGVGMNNWKLLEHAMNQIKKCKKVLVVHCEDLSEGIENSESVAIMETVLFAIKTKCPTHICHVSKSESVRYLQQVKKSYDFITFEVTPHHLLLNKTITKNNGNFKMNPPIGSMADQKDLLLALKKGIVDVIATDHAPHSFEEKNRGYDKSLNGVVGLETAFNLMYKYFVKDNIITLQELIKLMSFNPSKIFKIPSNEIVKNNVANLFLVDLNYEDKVNSKNFKSKGKSTPFDGWKINSKILYNIVSGKLYKLF